MNKTDNKTFQTGFTLIELLAVVLVISILSGVLLAVLNPVGVRQKTRDAQRITDLSKIQSALELYFADNRAYPISRGTGAWENLAYDPESDAELVDELKAGFLNDVPIDPVTPNATDSDACSNNTNYRYNYRTNAAGSIYILTAIMEVSSSDDDSKCNALQNWSALGCASGTTWNDAATDVCYGVENP